ncbi:MAG: putative sugar nucleotidyl transferase [Phycisphaerales bacterium]
MGAHHPSIPLVLFDDDLGRFGPMVDLRAAFEIRTGAETTARRVARRAGDRLACFWVPARLRAMVAERSTLPVNVLPEAPRLALLNGRLLRHDGLGDCPPDEALVEDGTGDVVAATLTRADAEAFLRDGTLPAHVARRSSAALRMVRRPWEILAALETTIAHDISHDRPREAREAAPATVVGEHPVSIERSAVLWPGVVIDAEHGPVAIHERAVVRAHATLCGPCVVGAGATVAEQAVIRPRTVIGPMCRVGGEVSGTIFQGFANKAHDGFLGDSYVGKWVNLGAGTTNSNLLNTYGEVSMRLAPDAPRERTGRQFLGAIIGDHAKLAIGTRLMTGTTIGTGAMIATSASPPSSVPAFAWLTDDASSTSKRWRIDRFEETMRTVMARRGEEVGEAYCAAVRRVFAGTGGAS